EAALDVAGRVGELRPALELGLQRSGLGIDVQDVHTERSRRGGLRQLALLDLPEERIWVHGASLFGFGSSAGARGMNPEPDGMARVAALEHDPDRVADARDALLPRRHAGLGPGEGGGRHERHLDPQPETSFGIDIVANESAIEAVEFAAHGCLSMTHCVTAWWKFRGPGTVLCVMTYRKPAFCSVRFGATLKAFGSQNRRSSLSWSK